MPICQIKTDTGEVKNPTPKRVNKKKWIKVDLARKINTTLCNRRKIKGKQNLCCFLGSDLGERQAQPQLRGSAEMSLYCRKGG